MRKLKFRSLIIVFLVLFTFSFVGCDEDREYKTLYSDEDIATLSIVSFDGKSESVFGLMNLGHCFLVIDNNSTSSIVVGEKEIPSGESVTIGTWSVQAHFGIWYNLESNYINFNNKYDGRVSITKGLTQEELEKINDLMQENNTWNPFQNCSYFALTIWNSIAENVERIQENNICTPTKIADCIRKFSSFETNKKINTEDFFGYFKEGNYQKFNLSYR